MPTPSPALPSSVRVLYSFPHAIGAPGIGTTAWNHVQGLAARGHDVHLLTASVARPLDPRVRVRRTLEVFGRRVPHRALGRDRALRVHDRMAARELRRGAYDVVHTWPLGGLSTLLAAREAGVPGLREAPNTHTAHAYAVVAAEIRRIGVALAGDNPHRADPTRLRHEQLEWDAASGVLVPSEPVERSFLAAGFSPDRLLRHRYGAEIGTAPPRDRADGRPFTAVFAGRGEPRKGLHIALDAWRTSEAARSGRLLVGGRIEPSYREVLGDRLTGCGVEELGFVDDLAGLLREADLLLLPSFEEGSALVTYEAQAAGCVPIVSDAAGAWPADALTSVTFAAGDTAALARTIDRLAGDRIELADLRTQCLARRSVLGWDAATATLEQCYLTAVGRLASERAV